MYALYRVTDSGRTLLGYFDDHVAGAVAIEEDLVLFGTAATYELILEDGGDG